MYIYIYCILHVWIWTTYAYTDIQTYSIHPSSSSLFRAVPYNLYSRPMDISRQYRYFKIINQQHQISFIHICIYIYIYWSIPIHTIFRGWTSIYQLFWCSPGVQGFDTSPYIYNIDRYIICTILSDSFWFYLFWPHPHPLPKFREAVPLVAAMPTSRQGPHCTATTVSPNALQPGCFQVPGMLVLWFLVLFFLTPPEMAAKYSCTLW